MPADIKARLLQGLEAYNEPERRSEYLDLHDPSAVGHGFAPEPLDMAGIRSFYDSFFAAFPDATFTLEGLVHEGKNIAVRGTIRGTHHGDFLGVPATRRAVEFAGTAFFTFRDDKIIERWDSADLLSLVTQLRATATSSAPG